MQTSSTLLATQAAWLAPVRARALRLAEIGRRQRVLDLGCGYGAVTGELMRRCAGPVIALDRDRQAVRAASGLRLHGDAVRLPLATASVDLVFTQFSFLWMPPEAVAEAARVLAPGGVLVALEPDYGGLIEHPPTAVTRELWLAGLARAGADPLIGRRLPDQLRALGLRVSVDLLNQLQPPAPERLDFLRDLPLSADERALLDHTPPATLAHLPVFIVFARHGA